MHAPALLRLALAGVALTATAGVAAADGSTATEQKLFFRNTGADCGAGDSPFLSPEKGTADINCGYIHGLPVGEAFTAAGQPASRTFSTMLPEDVEPEDAPTFRLDDAKALAAKIVVQSTAQQGQPTGIGQVRVVLDIVGQTADGSTVPLGGGDRTVNATPQSRTVELPFTVELADAAGDVDLVGITATLTTRGFHVQHGYARMNDSTLTLPLAPAAS